MRIGGERTLAHLACPLTGIRVGVPALLVGKSGYSGRDFDLFDDDDGGSDFAGHHLESLERLFEVCAREADKSAGIGDAELIVGLATTLEKTPFELRGQASEPLHAWIVR